MELVRYLLDSNIVIEAIRLYRSMADKYLLEQYGREANLCIISVVEIYAGKTALDPDTEKFLDLLVGNFVILGINKETAKLAGRLRCFYQIDIADAIIASAAIQNNLILATHNKKHFSKIKNLKIA